MGEHQAKLDYVVPIETLELAAADNLETVEVSQMPELSLALPEQEWFETQVLRVSGQVLGLTNKASVENRGSLYVWQEGDKNLTISPTIGLIRFSTAFNLEETVLPSSSPSPDLARVAVENFLTRTGLPATFYDLENSAYTYLNLDSENIPTPVSGSDGELLRMDIAFSVSGVPMFLPVQSFVVVDGEGTIRLLALLVPNVRETGRTITLHGANRARDRLEAGVGVVIDSSSVSDGAQSGSLEPFLIERVSPAYYIGNREFYSLGTRRVLTPVYVFGGEQGKVAVLAARE